MSIIKDLISGGASGILEGGAKIIDALDAPKEAKEKAQADFAQLTNSHIEKMVDSANKELETQLADVQNSRDANVKIQESANASWLSKNVAYCIDILLCLVWSACTIYILARALKLIEGHTDMTIVLSIHGTITAVFMTIVNFHRGTSRSSEDKSKQLHDLAMK